MPRRVVTIYSRKRCPLCDKAKAVLLELREEYHFTLEEVDIETSDELTERYGLMIPVVHIDGEEVAYGIVNKIDISNRLQNGAK
ncbi:glutaredoxin family protein [Neobacillus sp. YIM B02564]|uniref:Glutaredoxin family protein n=1 Tax=Neobacillus paridis TaxID=2803862 RepID=A0ABS1TV97_9BACI|nr:glutaredoxin family protein [Neobacillus paridis]MBL4954979.1 glutaredoxin family protein [Neobacillus paridis]